MSTTTRLVLATSIVTTVALAALTSTARAEADSPTARPRAFEAYAKLPLYFEPGSSSPQGPVDFVARGQGYAMRVTPQGAMLVLGRDKSGTTLRMRLLDASPDARIAGERALTGRINYFRGSDPSQWRTDQTVYAAVRAMGVYPGIDLVYYGNQRRLEYDFVVAPGADPGKIGLALDGAITIEPQTGDLVARLEGREVRFDKPVIYQPATPRLPRRDVEGRFVTRDGRVTFQVGAYDRGRALVIDPTLVYSTFLGGAGDDFISGIALDAAGNLYIAGTTLSTNFPTTVGALDTTCGTDGTCNHANPDVSHDAFVVKLNAAGTALVYGTYIGGSNDDGANAIAVDAAGNAYVGGSTNSLDFPVTAGAAQTLCAPSNHYDAQCNATTIANCDPLVFTNGFVTKLNTTGSALVYSTYIGGTGDDVVVGLAVDSSNQAHVLGAAISRATAIACNGSQPANLTWPLTGSAYTDPSQVATAVYQAVTKLNAAGSGFLYSSAFGEAPNGSSSNGMAVKGIAVGSDGKIYTTGYFTETVAPATLPTTTGAFRTTPPDSCNHGGCTYVAVFDPTKSGTASLVYSTYLGGSGSGGCCGDNVQGIAVDSAGSAYVTGYTASLDFPTTSGAFQTTNPHAPSNNTSGFVTKFNATGSALAYSTYLSGSSVETQPGSIAVDSAGKAYIAGRTQDGDFPLVKAVQGTMPGCCGTAFVSQLDSAGQHLLFSTFWGPGSQSGSRVATDGAGNIFLAGNIVNSSASYQTTTGAFQTTPPGNNDGYAAKFSLSGAQVSGCFQVGGQPLTNLGVSVTEQGHTTTVDTDSNGCFVNASLTPGSAFTLTTQKGPKAASASLAGCLQLEGSPLTNISVTVKQLLHKTKAPTDNTGCFSDGSLKVGKPFTLSLTGPVVP
jgi:hypothetical protein